MAYTEPPSSPYDPNVPNLEVGSVDLSDVILDSQRALSLRLRVALPAKVIAVDGQQQVQVQTLIKAKFRYQSSLVELPPIGAVPVLMPRGTNYSLVLPVAVGDTGLVIFTDRSLDVWLADQSGGTNPVDPQDTRTHDYNDAVFVPGLVPFSAQTREPAGDLVLKNGTTALRLRQNGTLSIGTQGTDLLAVIDDLIGVAASLANAIASLTVTCPPGGGPSSPPLNLPAFSAAQTQLSQVRTILRGLKT